MHTSSLLVLIFAYAIIHHQSLLDSAGIASGNVQLIGPICVLLLVCVGFLHRKCCGVSADESYSKAEKDGAIDAVAMALLLARDSKLKTQSSFRDTEKHSVISQLVDELSENTMLSDMSHKLKQRPSAAKRGYAKIVAVNHLYHAKHTTSGTTLDGTSSSNIGSQNFSTVSGSQYADDNNKSQQQQVSGDVEMFVRDNSDRSKDSGGGCKSRGGDAVRDIESDRFSIESSRKY